MSKKPFIKKKFKITMVVLLISSILSFVISIAILSNTDYRLSNYKSYFNELGYTLEEFLENGDFSLNGIKYAKSDSYNLATKDIKKIEIDSKGYDINVRSSNSEILKTYFTARGFYNEGNPLSESKWKFDYNKDSGTLKIILDPKVAEDFLNNSSYYDIDLLIPYSYRNNLKVVSTSGNIRISSGNYESLDIKGTSSNIDISSVDVENLNVQSTSGNISLHSSNVENPNFKSTSGFIRAENLDSNNINATTDSGDIDMFVSQFKNKLSLKSSSGNISLGLSNYYDDDDSDSFQYNVKATSNTGNIILNSDNDYKNSPYTKGNGKKTIDIKTTSGNVNLPF